MTLTDPEPASTEPVPVPTGVTNTYPVRLASAAVALFPAAMAVLAAFDIWTPTKDQLSALGGLFAALVFIVGEVAAGKVSSAATVAKIRNAVVLATKQAAPTPASLLMSPFSAETPAADLPTRPPPIHPIVGPVGGRSGPGTEGNV